MRDLTQVEAYRTRIAAAIARDAFGTDVHSDREPGLVLETLDWVLGTVDYLPIEPPGVAFDPAPFAPNEDDEP